MSTEAKPKTAKELEKERKKAEKLAKFEAKKAKQSQQTQGANPAKAAKAKPAKVKEVVPDFVDTTVKGEKKVLVSLDDPALKAYVPKNVESSWYEWWVQKGFFKPRFTADEKILPAGKFVIPAPPPNVTGALHIGHALTIALQDTLVRYYRMKGYTTLFIPGFDHAGISTQSVVEKNIWNKEKKTRHDFGREKFVDLVWEWKEEYHQRIKAQISALGASYDYTREAFTMDDQRSNAVYEAFVRLFEDGTLYRSERLVNWCVALQTTLSNLEVENKEIPGRSMVKVPGYDEPVEFGVLTSFAYPVVGSDEKLVVATTRPETIFGDTAVAIHPKDPRYTHLHGAKVKHPVLDREIPVVLDDIAVDMEFGTGAVKITPAHDPNDYETGKRHNLEFISIFNNDGTLNETAGPEYAGMRRFDARVKIIQDLKDKGLFVEQVDNPMSIPCCEKSGDVIEPVLKPQWWVTLEEPAKMAIQAVKDKKITVYPKSSESEFFRWLENIQDWCISRQLWWGHRCPVYLVELDGKKLDDKKTENWVAGRTREEAEEKARAKYPNASRIVLHQDEDVLDTWFSSGLWPLSTIGWPNVECPDFKNFHPMSMLETGWDILFFWVARMIMLSLKLTGEIPFKEVYCHSLVRDAQGRKMSKSLGNVVDPLDVISGISLPDLHKKLHMGNLDPREIARAEEGQSISFPQGIPECGTDALRFAMCAYTTGGRDINLDIYRVEGYRKFCNKIYQATKFALMRLGEGYQPPAEPHAGKSLVEKWILHKLSVAGKETAELLEKRQFMDATSVVYNYWLYEFCDVYIENSKSLILEGTEEERKSARDTLYTCLDGALRLIHPFMPFLTEELWQRIPKVEGKNPETICLAAFPDEQLFDEHANEAYALVLDTSKALRSLFADYGIVKGGEAIISAQGSAYDMLNEQQNSILSIVKAAAKITVTKETATPAGCVVGNVNTQINAYVLVKGHVDLDSEIKKAETKIAKIDAAKANLNKQKQVPGYEQKVKLSVREQNDAKLEGFDAEIKGLESVIREFERLKI